MVVPIEYCNRREVPLPSAWDHIHNHPGYGYRIDPQAYVRSLLSRLNSSPDDDEVRSDEQRKVEYHLLAMARVFATSNIRAASELLWAMAEEGIIGFEEADREAILLRQTVTRHPSCVPPTHPELVALSHYKTKKGKR